MSTGALLLPIGYTPLYQGAPVPGGKLAFFRTGTTTNQNTYSDSTLDTENANPVVLDANGTLDTLVYGDPSTGFDYRVRLLTSADATLWTFDDVVVPGADTATITEGSFTATLTGFATSNPTGTINYKIVANAAGTGKFCVLHATAAISGTSNATTFTMTGLPAACMPSAGVFDASILTDNNISVYAAQSIAASGSTLTFSTDSPPSATGWTNSGTKGIPEGWQMAYPL